MKKMAQVRHLDASKVQQHEIRDKWTQVRHLDESKGHIVDEEDDAGGAFA